MVKILSSLPYTLLVEALENEDLAKLEKISGIGKKTAQRMILELREKIKPGKDIPGKEGVDNSEQIRIAENKIKELTNNGNKELINTLKSYEEKLSLKLKIDSAKKLVTSINNKNNSLYQNTIIATCVFETKEDIDSISLGVSDISLSNGTDVVYNNDSNIKQEILNEIQYHQLISE